MSALQTRTYPSKRYEKAAAKIATHGHARVGHFTTEYRAWLGMKFRCYNPNYKLFHHYGARGIRVCDAWLDSFETFLAHVGRKPPGKWILDRIDTNKHYEPGNVRWADPITSARNKRSVRQITIDGATKTLPEWELVSPVGRKVIWRRLKDGWSERDAIFLPPQPRRGYAVKR